MSSSLGRFRTSRCHRGTYCSLKSLGCRHLTLFGRSVVLVGCELLANVICWIVAGILFGGRKETQPILSLSLLAWTIGLRHALDADHISAIDNATRGLISLGQLPVTCGLFFSLGHSTIVIVVNVAISISTDVADKIGGVGQVGGVIGSSVSAFFLFIVGFANSIILHKVLRKRRQNKKRREQQLARGIQPDEIEDMSEDDGQYNNTIMMKILGPVVRFVDRPWKMYPVGLLFGFGFDTASSIALLAASAIAKKGTDAKGIPPADVIILPMLFTAGMTLLDSVDSILMLYSYTGFSERRFRLYELPGGNDSPEPEHQRTVYREAAATSTAVIQVSQSRSGDLNHNCLPANAEPGESPQSVQSGASERDKKEHMEALVVENADAIIMDIRKKAEREMILKRSMMSGLSIVLTLMSIIVAFSISLITIMGLVEDKCAGCHAAAESDKGFAGKWWRFWAKANDNSGYIGAGIVGTFVLVVGGWYGGRWAFSKTKKLNK
ncbi:high-affinity nickel-transport protein-domain-containing protein [Multifurca ochricompacta]|uniref:Nickel/cobalt efflux system n=1 Tax=Multifurca ochricompacta TaxID=376703 RepID=A0AAD4QQB5_9AGAM|nr:high-affinity nickel-transport protein-domain-containing protein [Multifurca ochricompacta]